MDVGRFTQIARTTDAHGKTGNFIWELYSAFDYRYNYIYLQDITVMR